LVLVAVVAASACWTTSHLLSQNPPPQNDYHHWLHTQLGITAEQDKALDKEEERFAAQRKELITMIQRDNTELAAAMMKTKSFRPALLQRSKKSTMVKRTRKGHLGAYLRHEADLVCRTVRQALEAHQRSAQQPFDL